MASFKEFFGDFSPHSYANTIKSLKEHELRNEHALIQFKALTAKTGIGAGFVGVAVTGGVSLVGSGISGRRYHIMSQKLSLIEDRMKSKGWVPTEMRTRDILLAVGPTAVVSRPSFITQHHLPFFSEQVPSSSKRSHLSWSRNIHKIPQIQAVAPGAEHAVGHLISHAAGHGAATYAAHHTAAITSSALHNPAAFAHAAEQGAKAQVEAIGHALEGHATQLVATDSIANGSTAFLGHTAGQAAANTLELHAVHYGVERVVEKARDGHFRANGLRSGPVGSREGMALEPGMRKGGDGRGRASVGDGGTVGSWKGKGWYGMLAIVTILWYWYGLAWYKIMTVLPILWYWNSLGQFGVLTVLPILWYWYGLGRYTILALMLILWH